MAHAYENKVKPRNFWKGDLVLENTLRFKDNQREKFKPILWCPDPVAKVHHEGH